MTTTSLQLNSSTTALKTDRLFGAGQMLPALACATLLALPALGAEQTVRFITLDPGHFHAGLVQKFMYPQVSPIVAVYSPGGAELQDHLARIESFNKRAENPTHWEEKVYTGPDYLERMVRDKAGNVVVISGNNRRKTEYIDESIKAGLNVLADKPMAITPTGFTLLRQACDNAEAKHVLLYDIMTERYEVTSMLQRELAHSQAVFGTFQKGSPAEPAVVMESVHHYFKEVAGKPLIRPAWFYDVRQQGEGIPDIGTHLVDLVNGICFPEQSLNWKKDIQVFSAHRWPTIITPDQFRKTTALESYPDYLKPDVGADGSLQVFANGDVTYSVRGIHAKVSTLWRFEAPPGAKDTHYAVVRGTRANLVIEQGPAQKYLPVLYVENKSSAPRENFDATLRGTVQKLAVKWPGVEVKPAGERWEIVVPEKYAVGHEAHFAQVTEAFLKYLAKGKLPAWEMPNLLAKYYVTTEAFRLSHPAGTGQ